MSPPSAEPRPGRIEVICGCMFAGKTARLIERLTAAQASGRRVLAFKHALDDRYAPTELATHDQRRFPACSIGGAGMMAARVAEEDVEVVGIDEAQFFGPRLAAVCAELRKGGRHVIVAGIDNDAWGRPFAPLPRLKGIADSVDVMHAPCRVCGAPARYSQRMVPVLDQTMVGGPAEYEPRCAKCFVPLEGPAPGEC